MPIGTWKEEATVIYRLTLRRSKATCGGTVGEDPPGEKEHKSSPPCPCPLSELPIANINQNTSTRGARCCGLYTSASPQVTSRVVKGRKGHEGAKWKILDMD